MMEAFSAVPKERVSPSGMLRAQISDESQARKNRSEMARMTDSFRFAVARDRRRRTYVGKAKIPARAIP